MYHIIKQHPLQPLFTIIFRI